MVYLFGMLDGALPLVVLALALEVVVGDPVTRWHPVALFGRAVAAVLRLVPRASPRAQLGFGAALVGGSVGLVALGSALALAWLGSLAPPPGTLVGALLFKVSFSYRQLRTETLGVAAALRDQDLVGARHRLSALVSRDTGDLDSSRASSAAIESLAENLCDSVVAPFTYFVLFGVPGALAYRAINTLDAMVGYHGEYEYLGKVAARVDDVANWVPARVTAGLLAVGAWLGGADAAAALAVGLREHRQTESPNAGWPMAAMAGALRVRLEKPGHYVLGSRFPAPAPSGIPRAVRIADWVVGLLAAALVGLALT